MESTENEVTAVTESTESQLELGVAPQELETAQTQLDPRAERRRIEEQLNALKRREAELRRALAIADHPELAEAVRVLEGACYAVTRVEAKMAQGLSKSEEKRRETVEKKLAQAEEKRLELDAQIAEFKAELHALGEERTQTFEAERRESLVALIASLTAHSGAFESAGLEPGALIPDIARLMPEVRSLAESLVQARDAARSN
ncbi:MAG: hypothetical protein QM778_15065 [Myxococcales bacterium]